VHTDKAIKELRARLDVAIRERDEARGLLATESAERVRCHDGWAAAARERDEARAALAGEPARIAAAEMARDVAWVRKVCRSANRSEAVEAIGRALVISPAAASRVYDADYNDDAAWSDIADAIRAARGAS